MSLAWGWPLGFVAFAALLLPLLLHLDRRRTLRTLRFAALQWIGTRQRPRRAWRLTEVLLLLLRLLLLAALALWLAQPRLRGYRSDARTWIAVAPGADVDAIERGAVEPRHMVWLARGFPRVEGSPGPAVGHDTASLLREFDAQLAPDDRLAVRVPPEVGGLDAAAITLTREVDWQVPKAAATTPPPPASLPTRVLVLRYQDDGDASLRYIRAAATAWAASARLAVALDEGRADRPLPARFDALIWLGGEPGPQLLPPVEAGAMLAVIPPAAAAVAPATSDAWPPVAQRIGRGHRWRLATPLVPAQVPGVLSVEFPRELHRALFGDDPPPARARAIDIQPTLRASVAAPRDLPLRGWLAWIVAALFVLERVLANVRRRTAAA